MRIRLRGQPNDLLALLLERPGEVVTREELQKRLWPADIFVDFEHSLNAAVQRLRAALGDSADSPRFVETLATRGYRFIAPLDRAVVTPSDEVPLAGIPEHSPARPRWTTLAIGLAVAFSLLIVIALTVPVIRTASWSHIVFTPIRSLAVLPLVDLSEHPDQDYLADEITDSLRRRLAGVRTLRVISRTSSMHYQGSSKPVPEIAQALNVDVIVAGSVLRSGNRVRISVELVQGATDTHIWTGSFEGNLNEVMALQDSAAVDIANEIRALLTPPGPGRLARAGVYNADAYRAYATGRFVWNKRTEQDIEKAIVDFQQAVKEDPSYTLAWDGLADCWVTLGWYGYLPPEEAFPHAREALNKAINLDDSLAEVHTSVAFVNMYSDRNWPEAEREFRRAIDLNPNYANAHHWYGEFLSLVGRHDEAIAESERARELDPLSSIINTWVGSRYFFARKYEKAIDLYRSALEMDPNFVPAHLVLGQAYEQTGTLQPAIAELETAVRLSGGSPVYVASLAHAYGIAGRRGDAEKLQRDLRRLSRQRFVSSYDLAIAALGLGDTSQVIGLLERAVEERSPRVSFIGIDPRFDGLRSIPRFQQVRTQLGLQ
jgi:TolB-like protein/Tfp pilus assembly protein PilF/DNA-binding winged helix-turn-helix (wHTH) protein